LTFKLAQAFIFKSCVSVNLTFKNYLFDLSRHGMLVLYPMSEIVIVSISAASGVIKHVVDWIFAGPSNSFDGKGPTQSDPRLLYRATRLCYWCTKGFLTGSFVPGCACHTNNKIARFIVQKCHSSRRLSIILDANLMCGRTVANLPVALTR
jgi:hypothetical protein